jgi:acyl transferase domain-containing protein
VAPSTDGGPVDDDMNPDQSSLNDIAIVGMAAHLPGARNIHEFWENLRSGVESIRPLTEQQLLAAGVTRQELGDPNYVRRAAVLDDMDLFDAEFFGLSSLEADIMDPQQRHFLQCVWEALEDAAHVPQTFDGAIGVFGGCGTNSYFMFNLLTNEQLVRDVGLFLLRHTGNDKDFLTTRASHVFDLQGPSVGIQTACSTSLVAVHVACQSLLAGECDLALAGGSTIEIPHGRGYRSADGEILSPDGHCRSFDERAAGTVFGSGAGVVVLRRLADAVADGDRIYAIVKGSAVNNDGSQKAGYFAPSIAGQAACVAEALDVAGVAATSNVTARQRRSVTRSRSRRSPMGSGPARTSPGSSQSAASSRTSVISTRLQVSQASSRHRLRCITARFQPACTSRVRIRASTSQRVRSS